MVFIDDKTMGPLSNCFSSQLQQADFLSMYIMRLSSVGPSVSALDSALCLGGPSVGGGGGTSESYERYPIINHRPIDSVWAILEQL